MFFTPSVIGKRKPLGDNARRAGWTGCNIMMKLIPSTAKIPIIQNGIVRPIDEVKTQYNKIYNLKTQSVESRGWLLDTLNLT